MRLKTMSKEMKRAWVDGRKIVRVELIEWLEMEHDSGFGYTRALKLEGENPKDVRAVPMSLEQYSTNVRELQKPPFRVWVQKV